MRRIMVCPDSAGPRGCIESGHRLHREDHYNILKIATRMVVSRAYTYVLEYRYPFDRTTRMHCLGV